jgi:hypothetical protein
MRIGADISFIEVLIRKLQYQYRDRGFSELAGDRVSIYGKLTPSDRI